jgi:hypothetical protein
MTHFKFTIDLRSYKKRKKKKEKRKKKKEKRKKWFEVLLKIAC